MVSRYTSGARQFNAYNFLIILSVSFGSMSYGYASSAIAPVLALPEFLSYFSLTTRADGTALQATFNGLFQAGGFLGVFLVSYFADKYGRRVAIAVPAVILVITAALLAGTTNVGELIVWRFFAGAGTFMILSAVPIYMTETVPPLNRGMLVAIHGAALLLGYMVVIWTGYGLFFCKNPTNWRIIFALQATFPLAVLGMLPFLPESPRWLILKGRGEEAKRILERLHTAEEAQIELEQISNQLEIDKGLPSDYVSMFRKKSYRKRSLLALGTTMGIQFSGILVINNYQPTLYATLGYPTERQLLLEGGWITLAWGVGVLGCFIVDRMPRPKLIAGALGGCMVCLIIVAALIANFVPSDNQTALQAIIAFLYIYVVFYEGGLDGVQFAYLGELFPTHLRAKGMNLGVAGICLMNIIWLQSAPTGIANASWKYFLAYVIPGCLICIGIWVCFPDTRGVPLEEVAAMFGDAEELKSGSAAGTAAAKDVGTEAVEDIDVRSKIKGEV
ncbi:related to sugar transport STP1 [Lecanosticta acicola]|uniref:Related to sugar transport STP1 n=1 Tax=Lecanosticta acicola TaxID=111012 RepID=A0AAI9EBS8_9PEZI|nr:related to sugar transport STP1 [Lecanosticta acicola]